MKRALAFLLAVMLFFSLGTNVYADDISIPEPEDGFNMSEASSTENPVAPKDPTKATLSYGDLIRYIPISLDVTSTKVTVYGYFVNLNTNVSVGQFRNFDMDIYIDGDFLVGGTFGTIPNFSISPLSTYYQCFTFTGSFYNLNSGSYQCDDTIYCTFACNFSYW